MNALSQSTTVLASGYNVFESFCTWFYEYSAARAQLVALVEICLASFHLLKLSHKMSHSESC